ncbi:MAG TPA: HAMP domain-containing sensor histidine kinase [Mycobacteriales bacterium]|nr:HAMP domain-containing sensor histidine kinase [Mycobacteriales bacterium]
MRRQLLVLVAATTSLVLVAFLVPLALLLRSDAEDRATASASQQAQTLAAFVGSVNADDRVRANLDGINARGDQRMSVVLANGTVIGAPATVDNAVRLARLGHSFSTDLPHGQGRAVLVSVQGLPGGTAVVRAVVPTSVLHRGVTSAWLTIIALGVALLGLAVVLADQLGRALVRSVSQVAAVSDQLASGDLTARVVPDGPREVRRVGSELNRLAARIGELLTAEREEIADLSHRLRTPVTALRLDADSLRDPEERTRLDADIDALARTVDEVIRSARRPVREGVGASGDLAAVAADRARFWSPLAEDQGRSLDSAVAGTPLPVRASQDDLVAAVDALFGNVFAHTPEGAGLWLRVAARTGGGAVLVMDDAGPGFPNGLVLERGHSGTGSTGLGLDIVRRTAEAAGGRISLGASDAGGARVVAEFGPPA